MKILAFSCYYTPEVAASMYLTEDIYKGFVDAGFTVDVYVPLPTRGISGEVREEYKQKKVEKKYDGKLTVHRIYLYREGKNSVLRALRYLLLNIAFIWKGIRTQADIIFVQSTPPTQGMMAGILSKIKKIPYAYNLQDIFPDSLVNAGITTKGSAVWRIGRKIEDFSYRTAKRIIVISEDFKNNILAKGVSEGKIVVVPNWADCDGVYPVDREHNVLFNRYNLDKDKFYIAYTGNVGFSQNMDLLLEVAKNSSTMLPDISFVIIGEGVDRDRIQNRVETEHIDNVIMLPFQPYEDIADVFSLGDIGLIISKPGIGKNSVPSKTWGIMAAGKPVLACFDGDSDLVRLINDVKCGVCAKPDSIDDIISAILEMYQDKEKRELYGKNGYNHIKRKLNREDCVKKYVEAIDSIELCDAVRK